MRFKFADGRAPLSTAVGIIAGFRAEVRRLPADMRAFATCSGGQAGRAETLADAFVEAGVRGLISFGLAGGLDPHLRPGHLLLPSEIALPAGGTLAVDPAWHAGVLTAVQTAGFDVCTGPIAGRDAPSLTPADKATLASQTGAVAIDMESHAVAYVAHASSLPWLVLRAIGDPADRAVPEAALAGLAPDGSTRPLAVAVRLLRRPWALPGLIGLAQDSARGLAALEPAIRALKNAAVDQPGKA